MSATTFLDDALKVERGPSKPDRLPPHITPLQAKRMTTAQIAKARKDGARAPKGTRPRGGFKPHGVGVIERVVRLTPSLDEYVMRLVRWEGRPIASVTRTLMLLGAWTYEHLTRLVLQPDAAAISATPGLDPLVYLSDRAIAETLLRDILAEEPENVLAKGDDNGKQ